MNQRSTEIVKLLSKEKDEITVSGFAEYFQVSQKTIRNDLKEINTILNQNQREEVLIQSGGRINPPENFKESLSLLLEGDFYNYKLSRKERRQVTPLLFGKFWENRNNGIRNIWMTALFGRLFYI